MNKNKDKVANGSLKGSNKIKETRKAKPKELTAQGSLWKLQEEQLKVANTFCDTILGYSASLEEKEDSSESS